MINEKLVKLYCCEDPNLIENYEKAIIDTTKTWHCHHKFEIEMNLSAKELNDKNLYWNRPANELMFLTSEEHARIHQYNHFKNGFKERLREVNLGKKHKEETKQKIKEAN